MPNSSHDSIVATLAGVEEHFSCIGRFLQASGFKQFHGAIVICIGIASVTAWMMGYAAKARERIVRAIAFASDSENPYDLAYGRYFEGALNWLLREPSPAEAAATQALVLSEEHGFPLVASLAQTVVGWTRARTGNAGKAVFLIRQDIAGIADAGARGGISDLLILLAEAQVLAGLIEDALATL